MIYIYTPLSPAPKIEKNQPYIKFDHAAREGISKPAKCVVSATLCDTVKVLSEVAYALADSFHPLFVVHETGKILAR